MDSHSKKDEGSLSNKKKFKVVFVMGSPGSGKTTQCEKIVKQFGYTHLNTGDLLRAEAKSGSEIGSMIQNMIKEGKLVPSEITIGLIQNAMQEADNNKFLLDGFPRDEENRLVFENLMHIEPDCVILLDCPEEETQRRLLSRNQAREDDNPETIRKRFQVFKESSLPVASYYASKGKLHKVDAARPVEEVFESIKAILSYTKNQKAYSN